MDLTAAMPNHSMRNHFELLGMAPEFAIDLDLLERGYRTLQSRVHPDRYVAAAPAERRESLQLATRVNEAYRTLKSPLARARYLLQLDGVEIGEGGNPALPPEFLMQQMEWRESVEEARATNGIAVLDSLLKKLRAEMRTLEAGLVVCLDEQRDHKAAALAVCKLHFLERARAEIAEAVEALESSPSTEDV